jgi:hypothetical protein
MRVTLTVIIGIVSTKQVQAHDDYQRSTRTRVLAIKNIRTTYVVMYNKTEDTQVFSLVKNNTYRILHSLNRILRK